MADNKSCEVIGDKPSFIDPDDFNSKHNGVKMKSTDREAKRPEPPKSTTSKSVGSFHIDINCSDALINLKKFQNGLKDIQGELKETIRLLREFEEQQNKSNIFKRDYMCQWVDEDGEVKPIRPEVSG